MAGSLNQVTLVGNVGRDPEIRSMQNGKQVANLSLATSESWKNKDGDRQEKTEWHRITIFKDGLIGIVEKYVTKGKQILVQGALETRKWTDKEGNERYTTEIVIRAPTHQLVFLSRSVDGEGGGGGGQDIAKERTKDLADSELDDEIPF